MWPLPMMHWSHHHTGTPWPWPWIPRALLSCTETPPDGWLLKYIRYRRYAFYWNVFYIIWRCHVVNILGQEKITFFNEYSRPPAQEITYWHGSNNRQAQNSRPFSETHGSLSTTTHIFTEQQTQIELTEIGLVFSCQSTCLYLTKPLITLLLNMIRDSLFGRDGLWR